MESSIIYIQTILSLITFFILYKQWKKKKNNDNGINSNFKIILVSIVILSLLVLIFFIFKYNINVLESTNYLHYSIFCIWIILLIYILVKKQKAN